MKRKAFTLTELLVVVVVIAALAAVALPKYKRVIEARKTHEAEAIFEAVRTEQERRCAIGKTYNTNLTDMGDLLPKAVAIKIPKGGGPTATIGSFSTKNFNYAPKGQGLIAKSNSKDYSYTLTLQSYRDGRICCDGKDCDKFNYPKCDDLGIVATAPECESEDVCTSADCGGKGLGERSCAAYDAGHDITTTETVACSAVSDFTGGDAIQTTKQLYSTCSETVTYDLSQCYKDVTAACDCSNDPVYKLGGNNAKCTTRTYGDGRTEGPTVKDNRKCYKMAETTPGNYDCSEIGEYNGGYSLGTATGCRRYKKEYSTPKAGIAAGATDDVEVDNSTCNADACYKEAEEKSCCCGD